VFRALEQHGVYWLARLQPQTALYEGRGQRQDLLALRPAPPATALARAGLLGAAPRLLARLLAVRVPQEGAATRRRRWREAAQKKGRPGRATRLARAAWPLLVTNLPGARLTQREALVLARVRGGRSHCG
jgi:hypothetical protein